MNTGEIDYRAIGLKAGLECHQQLDVGKLFCRCPSELLEREPDFTFRRRLRPVPSELGEYDPAALEQFNRGLAYVYQAHKDAVCEVEMDEAPPRELNEGALNAVLEVALLGNCMTVDELVPMRKAVVDGSNTAGFQRTLLVGINGKLLTESNKEIGIQSLALEEDSARIISQDLEEITYRLDRLGIPLIELATTPGIHTPEEAKEFALRIGELFRITCKAKRGLGTIRQDLNISISEGARIEIKGIQELDLVDEFVRREAQRQLALIEIKKELRKRNLVPEGMEAETKDLSRIFVKSQSKLFKGKQVHGIRLKGFTGLLGKELQPSRRFGTELADYARQRAGLAGLVHSDEDLGKYKLSLQEIQGIKQELGIQEGDAFVLLVASYDTALKGFQVIIERCKQAFFGVPEETRNPLDEGNSEYSRPLPGPARMYPETDIPVMPISNERLNALRARLPKWPEERLQEYTAKGLSRQLAEKMVLDNYACLFEELIGRGFDATITAKLLLEDLITLRRNGIPVGNLSKEMIEGVLLALKDGKITKEVLLDVVGAWAKNQLLSLDEIIKGIIGEKLGSGEVEKAIQEIIEANNELVREKGSGALSALMGEAMSKLKGKASGKEISRILKEKLGNSGG
jgi:glutamyl-tRNA(Gln) amidotransferase subunit E